MAEKTESFPTHRIDHAGVDGRLVAGKLNHFDGWIYHFNDPITRITCLYKGSEIGVLVVDKDRPDLAAEFGQVRLGFWGPVFIPSEAEGDNVALQAVSRSGSVFELGSHSVPLTVSVEEEEYRRQNNLPDDLLMYLVVNTTTPEEFLAKGRQAAETIRDLLTSVGVSMSGLDRLLDFGVGCGRVLRWWTEFAPDVHAFGTDVNPALVEWCRQHLRFGSYSVNGLHPPTEYTDGQFDLLYAFSVFTHLPMQTQREWCREFGRILRPGGYALISTHGDTHAAMLPKDAFASYQANGHYMLSEHLEGSNACAVYQSPEITRGILSELFDIVRYMPNALTACGNQDLYLLQER